MKKIQLQGIGRYNAIEAKELQVNDVIIYNYGYKSTIKSIEMTKSGKSLNVVVESADNGKLYNRRYVATSLIAVTRVNAY